MADSDDLRAEILALEERKVQLIYAHRIAQAREHLLKDDLTPEERVQTEDHLAALEAAGHHLPKGT